MTKCDDAWTKYVKLHIERYGLSGDTGFLSRRDRDIFNAGYKEGDKNEKL